MSKCSACGFESAEGSKFCKNCGTSLTASAVCPACGVQILPNDVFCANCGFTLKPTQSAPIATVPVSAKPKKKFFKTRFAKIGLPIIAVVLVAAIVVTGLFIFDKKSGINYTLYIKDNEICFSSLKNPEPYELTERFIDGDIDDYMISNLKNNSNDIIQCTDDGKMIFFVDKTDEDDEGYNLFFRYTHDPDSEAEKIDSDVKYYMASADGKYVTYLKDDSLYQTDLENKEKIGKDVTRFYASQDGKIIIYQTDEGSLYYKERGKDRDKFESKDAAIYEITDDFKTVIYLKDDILYKKGLGKDKEKIDSDVLRVVKAYDSGEIYYLKEGKSSSLADFINDDMAEFDKNATRPTEPEGPVYPQYPSYNDYQKYDSYWDDYTTDWDAYYDACDEYDLECDKIREKYLDDYDKYLDALDDYELIEARDELRETIKASEYTFTASLCYYDGKKEHTLIENDVLDDSYGTFNYDMPIGVFDVCKDIEKAKVKLSDIDTDSDDYEIKDMISEKLYDSLESKLISESTVSSLDIGNVSDAIFSADGKTVYLTEKIEDDEDDDEPITYNLYKTTVSKNKPDKLKLYEEEVDYYISILPNDSVVYFKDLDTDDSTADMYIDKKLIDSDVYMYSLYFLSESTGDIAYMIDWDYDDRCGTLKTYIDKNKEKVADDVHDFTLMPNGEILYLSDYNVNKFEGELYVYQNGKEEKIDDDVTAVIHIYSLKDFYKYNYYRYYY